MNVNQVLESTLSPDAATRQAAEQHLYQAAESNFSEYLSTLAGELSNESAQSHIRRAAGIALKNAFTFREQSRLREVQQRWVQQVDPEIKGKVKAMALQTLSTNDTGAGQSAGQFIASIAAIELPLNQWPELMPALVEFVGTGSEHLKQAALSTIGYICELQDPQLRSVLTTHSNSILTAVVQGARKEETSLDVRNAAIMALSDALEFVQSNFDNEGERNYIMQVVCEATQSGDNRIEAGAFGCLNRIMQLYYDKMKFYMEKALYGLTIVGMQNSDEDVAKLAIEFWCTVCDSELELEEENEELQMMGSLDLLRTHHYFSRVASGEVVPCLMNLMTTQDEDAAEDEWNVSRAAYTCLQLFAQATHGEIAPVVLQFVEQNLSDQDWHKREAAVAAFGAILQGPDAKLLETLIKQGLPIILQKMSDENFHVRDAAAYALGRICENGPYAIDAATQLQPLLEALFAGVNTEPKMATSCCWALMEIANAFGKEASEDNETNPLSPHFSGAVSAVLNVTEKADATNTLRLAGYEVLNAFISNAATDALQTVAKLLDVIMQRLENTIPMQQQVVSIEDRLMLEEMQTSVTSCLMSIVERLGLEIKPQSDRIMTMMVNLLQVVGVKSTVTDVIFGTIGTLATSIEEDFLKYMDGFAPFLNNALNNHEEAGICAMAIGIVSDITRALGEKMQPYCDGLMNSLLSCLNSQSLGDAVKPAILQSFGDIAQAIGAHFESYLSVVGTVLQQAANIPMAIDSSFEHQEYVLSLREGTIDAWSGIILALKSRSQLLEPYIQSIFQLLQIIQRDTAENSPRYDGLIRSSLGVIGDIADTFPGGQFAELFRQPWVQGFIKQARQSGQYEQRTHETARWAKEQVKKQLGMTTFSATA